MSVVKESAENVTTEAKMQNCEKWSLPSEMMLPLSSTFSGVLTNILSINAHATLEIVNEFQWKRVASIYDGKTFDLCKDSPLFVSSYYERVRLTLFRNKNT